MVYHAQAGGGVNVSDTDTIAAISTPAGVGGIGIVRLSGINAAAIATRLAGPVPAPRMAGYRTFADLDGTEIDQGILLYFPAPHSYTGEDVVEFQCHGSPMTLSMLLARLLRQGARTAEPGEFTRRAFLNGKMDLAQAEAVVDLINSSTETAARCALRSLKGEFSRQINHLLDRLLQLRVFVEAAIDFPEEEIDFLDDQQLVSSVADIRSELRGILKIAGSGRVLREGLEVVIAGLPNAGKSSLLNRLAGLERSIVTPQPGTTRDTVDCVIDVDGMAVRVTDTAGLRLSSDVAEQQGVERAWQSVVEADLVLYVIDLTQGISSTDHSNLARLEVPNILIVWNKNDIKECTDLAPSECGFEQVSISAKHAVGLDAIHRHIRRIGGMTATEEGLFLARQRHLEALERSLTYVDQAYSSLGAGRSGELIAQDLRDAMDELGKLVGTMTPDQLLGEIFANFCIGK